MTSGALHTAGAQWIAQRPDGTVLFAEVVISYTTSREDQSVGDGDTPLL
jgi:hypothetical protein